MRDAAPPNDSVVSSTSGSRRPILIADRTVPVFKSEAPPVHAVTSGSSPILETIGADALGTVPDEPRRVHHIVKLGFLVRVSMYPVYMVVYGVHLLSRPTLPIWILACAAIYPLAWPHVARAIASRSTDTKRAELRNLLFDSFVIGCYVPLTGFSIWPNAAGLLSVAAGNASVGGGRFVLRGLGATVFGTLFVAGLGISAVDVRGASLLTECLSVVTLLLYCVVFGMHSFRQSSKVVTANRLVSEQKALVESRGVMLEERSHALEAALDAAEAANAAKGAFLANMSHELRTPLNSIIGFANVLLHNRAGRLRDEEIAYLSRIAANGSHLLTLINGILDLSKIDAGQMPLEIGPVDVAELIRDTLGEVEPLATANGVILVADVPAVAMLDADRSRLKQVLLNLVGNAVKFTPDGTVTVVLYMNWDTGQTTRIDVTDTGVGIARDRLQAVFEAFQQEDTTTSRKFGGTGLGLTITRSLVELMGWRISAESEQGRGSTFSVITSAALGAPTGIPTIVTPVRMPSLTANRSPVLRARVGPLVPAKPVEPERMLRARDVFRR